VFIGFDSVPKKLSWSVHINTIISIASKLLYFSNQLKTVGGRDVTSTKTLKYKYNYPSFKYKYLDPKYKYPSFKYKYKYSGLKYKYLDLKYKYKYQSFK